MTRADGWNFVRTGPGDVAGRYLRRFWQPVYQAEQLVSGQAVPIRVMGEDFTLYRGETGVPHVVAFRCPHRGTQLSSGWVEGDDLRCFFHGWKFDPAGACLEQPAEPRPFCHKVKIACYPTREQFGLIFAYFGDEPVPPLPTWPELETTQQVSSMALLPCNYFQSAENIVDDVHVGFAHRGVPELGLSPRGRKPPRVAAEETSYGLRITYTSVNAVSHNHFLMPNLCYVSYTLYFGEGATAEQCQMKTLFWYVPIDDVTHHHVMVTVGRPLVIRSMRREKQAPHSVADDIRAVLAGKATFHKGTGAEQRRPDLIRVQDGVTIVGQGEIADRSNERLGASDAGVILLRKLWTRELRALDSGDALTSFSIDGVLPADPPAPDSPAPSAS